MKRKNLLKIAVFSVFGILATDSAMAQTPLKENIGGNLGGTRFVITAPSSIAGIKKITIAPWGAAATPTIFNAPIEKAYDTLAAMPLLNGTAPYPDLTGKFALVFRGGGINFTDKVIKCKDKGAIGVIIVNNVAGEPVGMGAVPATFTTDIPVVMVSDVDGMAINNIIKSSAPGTATLTLGTWNLGSTHDLGIVSRYLPLPSALNIPFSQMSGASGKVYNNHYISGAVANYGTATETNVTVTDSIFWTPKGSSVRSYLDNKSFLIPSISPSDSIKFGFGTPYTIPAPSSAGKYEHVYSISYANTDEYPEDNRFILNQFITDSVYSKVPLNPTTGKITSTIGLGPANAASGSTFSALVGSMMYVNNPDLLNNKYMQYSLSIRDVGTLSGATVFTHLLKWTDTAGGSADFYVQASELEQIAISAKELKVEDSTGDILTVKMLNIINPDDPTLKVELTANTWYVLLVEVPEGYYLGYNQDITTFTRAYSQFVASGSMPGGGVDERDEVSAFRLDLNTMLLNDSNIFANYPYGAVAGSMPATNNYYIDSVFYDQYKQVPSIALITTPNELDLSILEKSVKHSTGVMNVYPVPATNSATVTLNFETIEKNVEIRLFDAIGRTVYAEKRTNVKSDKFDIDLSKVAPGNYHVVASTGSGLLSKSIVVIK